MPRDLITIKAMIGNKIGTLHQSYKTTFGSVSPPILIQNLIRVMEEDAVELVIEESPRGKLVIRHRGKAVIVIPRHYEKAKQRLTAAHEIAHLLMSNDTVSAGATIDIDTGTLENEVFDYGARMLLMPRESIPSPEFFLTRSSIAKILVDFKKKYQVSAHAVIRRLFDDTEGMKDSLNIEEVIIWQISKNVREDAFMATPQWKLTKGEDEHFIPIGKCFGKKGSSAYNAIETSYCVRKEDVRIGTLKGKLVADSCGYWWRGGHFNRVISVFRRECPGSYPLFS